MTDTFCLKGNELALHQLDNVAGGIIVVGGFQHRFEHFHASSVLDRIALNPQPLPPKVSFDVQTSRAL
ncbi:hypothetical protein ACRQ5Q_09295 [Bradyrhizobium sp. PMVTL-01]|uniref:hypothetical protein n=1 Tax=Bradyrhizobium sp. PMVTL-01 TaxID=3434999 RepID=UPI003F6EF11A